MITQEQAKQLRRGDKVHRCPGEGQKCEVWRVAEPYEVWPDGWFVDLARRYGVTWSYSGINATRMEEWHLPDQCPTSSRLLRVEVHRVYDGLMVEAFNISLDDTLEHLLQGIQPILEAAQNLADKRLASR